MDTIPPPVGTDTSHKSFLSMRSALRTYPLAYGVLVAALLITFAVAFYVKSGIDRETESDFITHCLELHHKVAYRLEDHARVLQSGAALFNTSEQVTRESWHTFTTSQRIEKQLPGIQGFGFSLLIPPPDLPRHIQAIRKEGFQQYTVRPPGKRDIYSSIIYLEPFSGRNLRAFGFDMYSEATRRAAMDRARDTNEAALSGKVVLVQETGSAVQPGTLMYVPVYHKGLPTETVAERRAAIRGWVYSPYRMTDLMEGILSDHYRDKAQPLHLQIYDSVNILPENLLYQSIPGMSNNRQPDIRFTHSIPLDFNGQRWNLSFALIAAGIFTTYYASFWITLVSGMLIALLLCLLIRSLLQTRAAAQRIADDLTKEIQQAREYAESIVETVRKPLLVLDATRTVITANRSFYETFDVTAQETIGKVLFELGNRQWNIPQLHVLLDDILYYNSEISGYEVEHDFPNIGHKIIMLNARQIIKGSIGSYKILLGMEDITLRKQFEADLVTIAEERILALAEANQQSQELAESNQHLQEVSRAKSDFLASMSHELRTPLNSVIGFSEVLHDQLFGPINAKQHEHIKNIIANGKHLLALISDILDLAKVESGKTELDVTVFPLGKLLADSVRMLSEKAGQNTIQISLVLDPSAAVDIMADNRMLKQIMYNLLSNAVKFSHVGGTVKVNATKNGDNIEISVEDNGCGIRPEDIPKLFTSFTQLESVYTKKHAGTGLGLALSRKLVELHGGMIQVESEFGSGSIFSFTIPLTQNVISDNQNTVRVQ